VALTSLLRLMVLTTSIVLHIRGLVDVTRYDRWMPQSRAWSALKTGAPRRPSYQKGTAEAMERSSAPAEAGRFPRAEASISMNGGWPWAGWHAHVFVTRRHVIPPTRREVLPPLRRLSLSVAVGFPNLQRQDALPAELLGGQSLQFLALKVGDDPLSRWRGTYRGRVKLGMAGQADIVKKQAGSSRDDRHNRNRAGPPSTGDAESVPRGMTAGADSLLPRSAPFGI
jgi:hypothetical protein